MAAAKTAKQQRGRPFAKGESGNPSGRPAGSRHRVTLLVEQLIEGQAEALTDCAIQNALAGDPTLLKALLDRLAPPRKERPVQVALPPLKTPQDAPGVIATLLEKVASGELAPGEATAVAGLLESYRKQSELADLEVRIAALEARHADR